VDRRASAYARRSTGGGVKVMGFGVLLLEGPGSVSKMGGGGGNFSGKGIFGGGMQRKKMVSAESLGDFGSGKNTIYCLRKVTKGTALLS